MNADKNKAAHRLAPMFAGTWLEPEMALSFSLERGSGRWEEHGSGSTNGTS
jgi:hypothetical protein